MAAAIRLTVQVKTRKSETRLFCELDGTLTMHVTATPEKEKANREIRKWLSRKLGTSTSNVQLVAGFHSNVKIIEIRGIPDLLLETRLGITLRPNARK